MLSKLKSFDLFMQKIPIPDILESLRDLVQINELHEYTLSLYDKMLEEGRESF